MQRISTIYLFALVVSFACLSIHQVHAQESGTVYVQIDYMKVPPGGGAEYVQMEQDVWKPIHQERIKRGVIMSWDLYGVWFAPAGIEYDYVTVNVFDELSDLEGAFAEEIVTAAHPNGDIDALMQRTEAARDLIHSEVWQLVDGLSSEEPGNYIMVNFMSVPPGADAEYLSMEQEIAKPMHEARVQKEMMTGWHMYQVLLPSGTSVPYNYATVDGYQSVGDLGQGFATEEIASMAYPGVSQAEVTRMWESIPETRSIYKSELWVRVDNVSAESTGSD